MPNDPAYVLGMSPPAIMTADELLHIPDKHAELVRGVLVVREPAGLRHGRIATELAAALAAHVRANGLGRVYVESGFKLAANPDTVRGPDLAFISQARLPEPEPVGFRSEEHTSELQSQSNLVCRLLLEKKNTKY